MPLSRRSVCQWLKSRIKYGKLSFKRRTRVPDNATPVVAHQPSEHVAHQPSEHVAPQPPEHVAPQPPEQPGEFEVPREVSGSQDEPREQEVALAEENTPTVTRSLETEPQASSDRTPIWTKSQARFQNDSPELYGMVKDLLEDVQNLGVDNWDTWLNKPRKDSNSAWFRRFKTYLPQFKSSKALAMSLSNLDPHKIAPLVTAGVFLAAEFCFETVDPSIREKAMNTILNSNIIVVKWLEIEPDLKLMKERIKSSDIDGIEQRLEELYLDSLVLIFTIYRSGETRSSRAGAVLAADPPEWDRKYNLLVQKNSTCMGLNSQVESKLKKLEDVLKWIKPGSEDPEPAHQTVMERTGVYDPESKAGRWFLETEEFSSWIDQIRTNKADKTAFWLKGSMGTGKTTLMCRVISHFEELPLSGVRFLRYYCFGSKTATESKAPTYETILRALCYQLSWNNNGSVAEPAKSLYDSLEVKGKGNEPLTTKRLEELLKSLLDYSHSTATTIVFVIDALDECHTKYDSKKLLAFLRGLQQGLEGLYFLISSRPHVNVGDYFEGSIQVFNCVQPQAKEDMTNFIKSQIDSKRGDVEWKKSIFFKDNRYYERLESALSKSANGMFRWVQLWLSIFFPKNKNSIRRPGYADTLLEELENLQSLPKLADGEDESLDETKRIEEAYRRLWDITDGQYKKYQIRLFQIVMGAFEPLSIQQLLEAVSFDPDNPNNHEELELDELKGLYCNFLRPNIGGRLDFEHISARIFISEMKEEGSNKLVFSENENQYTLADISIKMIERPDHWLWEAAGISLVDWGREAKEYLEMEKVPSTEVMVDISRLDHIHSILFSNHFGTYIFRWWVTHCQPFRRNDQFIQRIYKFIRDTKSSLEAWVFYNIVFRTNTRFFNAMARSTYQSKEVMCINPLLCMVSLNFSPFVHNTGPGPALLLGLDDITAQNLKGRTALHIACELADSAIVEDLLKFERTKRQSCRSLLLRKDCDGKIPMHKSTKEDIVKILLKYEMLESHETVDDRLRISELLDCEDEYGVTPLIGIIRGCSDDYLQEIFTQYYLEPGQSLYDGVWAATEFQKIKTLRLLVKNKANTSAKKSSIMTLHNPPLHIAVERGNMEMIDLLLNWGEGMKTISPLFGPVICTAVASRDTSVVQYFLDRGANISGMGKRYGTVLGVAAYYHDIPMAMFLLGEGADVNAKGGRYGTPLGVAACFGNIPMAMFLLGEGADVNAKGGPYETPLGAVGRFGERRVARMVKFLIEEGALIELLSEENRNRVEKAIQMAS